MKNKILLKISIILVVSNLMSCGKEKSNNVIKIESETQVAEVINDLSLIGMDLGQFQEKYALSAIKVEDKKINYLIKVKNDRECNIIVDTADRKIVSVDSPDCFIPNRDSLKSLSNDYTKLIEDITQKNIRLSFIESKYNLKGERNFSFESLVNSDDRYIYKTENQKLRSYTLGDCKFDVYYYVPTKVVDEIILYRSEKCEFSLNFLGLQFESPNMTFGEFIRTGSKLEYPRVHTKIELANRCWGDCGTQFIGVMDNRILINVELSRRHNNVEKHCSLVFDMDDSEGDIIDEFRDSDGFIPNEIAFTTQEIMRIWDKKIPKSIKFSYCDDELPH